MKKMKLPILVVLLAFSVGHTFDLFDYLPIPKKPFREIGNFFSDIWDGVDNNLIKPVENIGRDAIKAFIQQWGLAPDVSAEIEKIADKYVFDTYGILQVNAGGGDQDGSLLIFTDPVSNKVFYQDRKNQTTYQIPSLGDKTIPTHDFYAGEDAGVSLNEPRGITTDMNGRYWIADSKNNRIVNVSYDNNARQFHFIGSVDGIREPYSVAFSDGASYGPDDDFIFSANPFSNSVCKIPNNVHGPKNIGSIYRAACFDRIGTNQIIRPMAIAVNQASADFANNIAPNLFLAYGDNQIIQFSDGGNSLVPIRQFTVPGPGVKITGMAADASQGLYLVDQGNGQVVYFAFKNGDYQQIWKTGSQGEGSTASNIKFNQPRQIALFKNDALVSEKWSGQSGIQRFSAIPVIDRNNTSVSVYGNSNNKQLKLDVTLSVEGMVEFQLEYVPDLNSPSNRVLVYQLGPQDEDMPAGLTEINADFKGNTGPYQGLPLTLGGLYRMRVKAYLKSDLTNPTDEFFTDLVLGNEPNQFQVAMKDNVAAGSDNSQPEMKLTNLSGQSLQNFTIRLWLSKEEMPSQQIQVDKYYFNPDQIMLSTGIHPDNSNICFVDFKYPSSYSLASGATTPSPGLSAGVHFKNYWPGVWDRSNDYSWQGITSTFSNTENVTVFTSDGKIVYGTWPTVAPPQVALPPSASGTIFSGFEKLADWGSTQSTLSLNSENKTEGSYSLSVTSVGWSEISSSSINTSSLSGVTSNLSLDVFVPNDPVNQWWAGSVEIFASCPTAGVYNAFMGHYELTTLPRDQFSRLIFNVPNAVLSALRGNFNDFTLKLAVNTNAGAPAILFDNLRFVELPDGALGITGRVLDPSGAGLANARLCLTGSQSLCTTSDASGYYSFSGLSNGGYYTITPEMEDLTFNPLSRSISNLQSSLMIDFSATGPTPWAPNTQYVVGAKVYYQGGIWTCIQSHTSISGQEPPLEPSLWSGGGGLPSPWSSQNIGAPGIAGGVSYDNGNFKLNASGTDIWGTSDAFRFAFQYVPGNFELKARVLGIQNTNAWAKAGLMIRETLDPNSKHASVFATPMNGLVFQYRTSAGSSSNSTGVAGGVPVWLKITRTNESISVYWSNNGSAWTRISSAIFNFPNSIYVGLAATSHDNGKVTQAEFENVSITSLPDNPFTSLDIGAVGVAGGLSHANGVYTSKGSGSDIWGNSDQFNFSYAVLQGDGQLSARVFTVANTDPWAKAGLMVRETLAANSRNAMIAVTPGSGVTFQHRDQVNSASTYTSVGGAAPTWLRIVRTGNIIRGYMSSDGTNWTFVSEASQVLPYQIYFGLAVTSHNNSALCQAQFDNIISETNAAVYLSQDVGSVGVAGSTSQGAGTVTVAGSGADIWSSADGFQFYHRSLYGDGEIKARVVSMNATDPWAKVGVMIREDLTAGSRNVFAAITSSHGATFQNRSSVSGSTSNSESAATAPYWVRLVRTGDQFTGFKSTDGTNWVQIGNITLSMAANIRIGLATTSHNTTALNSGIFDGVTISE